MAVFIRDTQIPVKGVLHPTSVLHQERIVESHLLAHLLHHFPAGSFALNIGQDLRCVAGSQILVRRKRN